MRGVRIEIENGDVLVSCHSSQSFIFSTVYTEKNGYHPVSGNRGFGILDNGNGSWTLFTKGADRMSGYLGNAAEVIRQFDSDAIFKEGHKIWVQLLNNIATEYTKQKPRNQIVNSHRYPYPL